MKYTAAVVFCFVAFVGSTLGRRCGSHEKNGFWEELRNATDNCTKLGECENPPCFKGESDDPKNAKCVLCVLQDVKLFANGAFNRTRIDEVFKGKKSKCIVNCVNSAEAQTKDSLVLVQQVLQCLNAEGCFNHHQHNGTRYGESHDKRRGHHHRGQDGATPTYGTASTSSSVSPSYSTPNTVSETSTVDDQGESFDDESSDDESPFDEGEESGSGSHER